MKSNIKYKAFIKISSIFIILLLWTTWNKLLLLISKQWVNQYEIKAKDSARVQALKNISEALVLYWTNKYFPLPDDKVDIKIWTWINEKTIAYQWKAWKNVLEQIWYSIEEWVDPKDGEYYSYYVTKDKKHFQLMAFLENEDELKNKTAYFPKVYAIKYKDRYPTVWWNKLWILTDKENTPIEDISAIQTAWKLNISTTTDTYIARISDKEKITWTWFFLVDSTPQANCKRVYQALEKRNDWIYKIDPEGNWIGFDAYCDMTTDGGGWMLVTAISKWISPDYNWIKNAYLNNENYNSNWIYILNKIVKNNISQFSDFIVDYQYWNISDSKINENYFIHNKLWTTNIWFSLVAKTNWDTYNDLWNSEIIAWIWWYTFIEWKIPDDIDLKCNSSNQSLDWTFNYWFRKWTNTFFWYYWCWTISWVFSARLDWSWKIILFAKDSDTDYNAKKMRFWIR